MRLMFSSRTLRRAATAALLLCVLPYGTFAVPLSSFYPSNATDVVLPRDDDSAINEVTLSTAFPFFGVPRTTAFVNTNGVISFNGAETGFVAQPFPIIGSPMLAPFWGDVDTLGEQGGEIRYRQTNDSALLSQARADVREVYPTFTAFNPTRLLIATWDRVAHYDSVVAFSGLTNTFQCVLITDGTISFVIFLYADDLIQWSVGTADLSAHAQAGFNAGDGIRHTTIEGSRTEAIVNIETTSNIGVPGKYLFRVDTNTISATPPPAPDVVFLLEPSGRTLSVNGVTEVKCSAYVSSEFSTEFSLGWTIAGSSAAPSPENGFSVYNNSLEVRGLLFVTTVLVFSGSSTPVTHSLACNATIFTYSFSREFTLTITQESVSLTIDGPADSALGVEENLTLTCRASTPSISYGPTYFLRNGLVLNSANIDSDTTTLTTDFETSTLTIASVEHEDGGVYGCVRNSGGSGGAVFVETNITVREEVPALNSFTISVDGNIETTSPTVVVTGSTIVLSCSVYGIPIPSLDWTRDGVTLSSDLISRTLSGTYNVTETVTVQSAATGDSGLYACVATNRAGSSGSASAQLQVLSPPQLVNFPANTEVESGQTISLTCVAEGSSLSGITWSKDDTILETDGPRLTITSQTPTTTSLQSVVLISPAELGDSGNYSCRVSSPVGNSSASFDLFVAKRPLVTSLNFTTEVELRRIGEDVVIECRATGVPTPAVMWRKDGGAVLINSSGIIIITSPDLLGDDSSVLSVLTVVGSDASDGGEYSCTAMNLVGSDTLSIELNLLIPPVIVSSPGDSEVVVSNSISLFCSSTGVPPPVFSWYGPGDMELSDSHIIEGGFFVSSLTITAAAREDVGVYNCTAINSVGSDSATFNLLVLEPPEVVELVFTAGPEVAVGRTAELQCTAFGVPAPTLWWEVTGPATFTVTNSSSANSTSSVLEVSPVALSHHGPVSCTASNGVGPPASSTINLTVLFGPVVTVAQTSQEVVVGESVALNCSAEGRHLPLVSWTTPAPVSSGHIDISYSPVDETSATSSLTISATLPTDTGTYYCTGHNSIGNDTQSIFLQVLVPPEVVELVFTASPEVAVGRTAELQCTAFGVPAPTLWWEVTGPATFTVTNSSSANSSSSVLEVSPVVLSHHGPVSCTASNGVGPPASSTINLTVLFGPVVAVAQTSQEVVVGESVALNCSAEGRHLPLVSWTTPAPASSGHIDISYSPVDETSATSSLTISATLPTDTGIYYCTGHNSLGNDTQSIFLQVLEPAEILDRSANTSAVIGESVTLYCETRGVHPPTVVWSVNGSPVVTDSRVTILSERVDGDTVLSELNFNFSVRSDNAVYSCSASNSAGSDAASTELSILEPAMVVVYPEDIVVLAGDSVLLTCVGYGVPAPSLSWQRNGETVAGEGSGFYLTESIMVVENTVFVRSSLLLCNTSETDTGNYSCSANNSIQGPATKNFSISIQTIPPAILMYPEDVSVEVHSTVRLACTAFGAPAPSVVWNASGLPSISTNASGYTVENRSVVTVGALSLVQSVLHVCGFSLATAGSYTCSAENYAGTTSVTTTLSLNVPTEIAVAPNDTSVYVGDTVALSCVSHGLPFPSISWTRQGEPLRQPVAVNQTQISGGHVTFLQSTLLLCSLTLSDTGLYTCSASNNHSSAQQTFSITVKVVPRIVIYPNDSAFFAGSTVRFSCTSYGVPAPHIRWSRDSLDLHTLSVNDTRIHIWNETIGIGPTSVVRSHLRMCGTVVGDGGNYSCTASTPERQDRAQFLVNVIGVPPTLIQTPVDVDIVAEKGNSIVATCIAYGNPAPVISWSLLPRFSGTLSTATSATEVTNTTDSTVYTRQLVDDDSGVGMVYSSLLLCPANQGLLVSSLISCTASNGVSSGNTTNSHSFLINVTVEPQVLNEQTDHEVFVTETVSLVCRADGVPLPEILWLKDGCPLSRTIEELPRFQITQRVGPGFRPHVLESMESVLTIENSVESDSGAYSCRATNALNTAYLPTPHQVTVNTAPVLVDICSSVAVSLCQNGGTCLNRGNSFSCQCTDGWTGPQCDQNDPVLSAPVLVKSPQTTFSQLFSETVLECGAVGNPQPLITWFKDGLEMTGATAKTLVIGEVDLSDRAAYHCTAVNSQGSVTSEVAYLNIMGLAQYAVVVISVETDLSEVDKWFDVNIEGTDTDIGSSGMKASVLCIDSFNQTGEEMWSSLITLQSVDGEDLKLPQVAEGISNLLTRAGDELRIELFLYDVTRTVGCPEVTTILFNSTDFELPWPELPYGGLAEISCPCNAASLPLSASRRCAGNTAGGVAEWAEPDDSQCHFTEATRILCSVPDTEELSLVTDHPEDLGTLEVFLSAVNIQRFSDNTTTGNATRSDEILAAIDHLLSAPPEVLQQSQQEFNSSTLILEGLREVIDHYPLPETPPLELPLESFTAIIDFGFDLDTFNGSSARFTVVTAKEGSGSAPELSGSNLNTLDFGMESPAVYSSVSLSRDLAQILQSLEDPRIVYIAFTNNGGIFAEREEFAAENNRSSFKVGSVMILEARLTGGATVSDLSGVVTLSFEKTLEAVENGTESVCVFWEEEFDEGHGGWSTEGCRLVSDDELVAVCECDHLTSFSLLVDTVPHEPQVPEDRGIGPYVYTGCLFSALFLLITILTLIFTRWNTGTGVFLLNSATSLLLLNLIFVAAYYSGGLSEHTCHGVSGTLHYMFLTAAFSLAGLALVKLRGAGKKEEQRTLRNMCMVISGVLATWFVPAVIVALTLSLSETYNTSEFCRPVDGAFHYGLILPWALAHLPLYLWFLLVPCPYFSLALRDKHVQQSWVREYTGTALTLFLFDVSWGFGLPSTHPIHVDSLRFYSQIIFSVASGCIGPLLFLFFCIASEKVRKSCASRLGLGPLPTGKDQSKGEEERDGKGMIKETEETPAITFQYDLNEVYGNPAAVTADEEYEFQSETQFN